MTKLRVVICGGGIAAVEALLRLRRLAGDAVKTQLVAPNDELVLRPLAVRQPFGYGSPDRYPLERIAADAGAELVRDSLAWVDPAKRAAHTSFGAALAFDALLVAVGARQIDPFDHVQTFHDAEADESFQGIVQDIEGGFTRSVAFLLPDGPAYPLPLYELALMTAERARSMGIEELDLSRGMATIRSG